MTDKLDTGLIRLPGHPDIILVSRGPRGDWRRLDIEQAAALRDALTASLGDN